MPPSFDFRKISHRAKKCNVKKFPQLLCTFLCFIQKKTTINALNTMEKRGPHHLSFTTAVLDALKVSRNLDTFPHISTPLQIFATLPVTTSSSERSIFQCTEVYQELSSLSCDWWTFKRTGSVRTSRHYARLWCVIDEFGKSNRRLQFC